MNHEGRRLAEQLRELGIVQVGDPILRAPTEPFDLPTEADAAAELLDRLAHYLARVAELYPFTKGMGLAAPQIGVSRAAAIVRPPEADEIIQLVNPVVVDATGPTDHRYEGCLSFFDVRGVVERPLTIDVQVTELSGDLRVWSFREGIARLVMHEIDHLSGRLYTDDLVPDTELLPLEQYRDVQARWHY